MPEETKPGTPTPHGQNPHDPGPQVTCAEFEALLMDALEGHLTGSRQQSFDAHRRSCALCGPMFAEVEAGRHWLRSLEPVEPPVHLVHNILVATSGVASTRRLPSTAERATSLGGRVQQWWDSWFAPVTAFARQPRFVMSFGMIFFSFSLALSVAGFKVSDVAKIDLRPAALRHAYNETEIRVVKYYDNIRFVYEIESKVRELKRATEPAEPAPQPKRDNRNNNDTSGQPEQRQDRNYSSEQNQTVLASLTEPPNEVRSGVTDALSARSPKLEARSCSFVRSPRLEARSCSFARSPRLEARSCSFARSSKLVARSYNRRYV